MITIFLIAQTVIDCGPLPPPLDGQIVLGNTTAGNVAVYLCDSEFVIHGDESRVCGADGFWSGGEPTCEGMIIILLYKGIEGREPNFIPKPTKKYNY